MPVSLAISEAAEKGAELTHRLLAFSRRQLPRPEPLDLTALIADDEEMVRRLIGDDVRLITRLDPSLDPVRADAGQIRQVLLNLIVNAARCDAAGRHPDHRYVEPRT